MDEIYFLIKNSDRYRAKIGLGFVFQPERLTESRRKKFNFSFVNLCKKYGIIDETLYNNLDEIWSKCRDENEYMFRFDKTTAMRMVFKDYLSKVYNYYEAFGKEQKNNQEDGN